MNRHTAQEQSVTEAIHRVYSSYNRAKPDIGSEPDRIVRHPEWTRRILDVLGEPDRVQSNVAVTGSKGKGSHAIFLAAILQKLGLRVGLFTSPHLVNFLERFRVNGQIVPDSVFVNLADKVQDVVRGFELPRGQYVGPVGILSVIATLWFQLENTDVNIFELGRGARHDDVNQINHIGAVLTPVFLEHGKELGPTLKEVCHEKMGIITPSTQWLVSYRQSVIFREILKANGSPPEQFFLDEDIQFRILNFETTDNAIEVQVVHQKYSSEIKIDKAYLCYVGNVAVAFAAAVRVCMGIRPKGRIPEKIDLTDLYLPGRMQVLSNHPLRLLDGTVHSTSAKLVSEWLERYLAIYQETTLGLILSIPAAKDGQGVLNVIGHYFSWICVVPAYNPHLLYTQDLFRYAKTCTPNAYEASGIREALDFVEVNKLAEHGICFLGTQSFIGDVLTLFECNTESVWLKSEQAQRGFS